MVTAEDIAKQAGLSRYTVSKVLNGAAGVRQATRDRVLRICDELGYIPDHNARGLRRGATDLVALVVPYVTDQFYSAMIEELELLAAAAGFMLIYKSSYNDAAVERAIIRSFLALKVCALLAVPATPGADLKTHELAARNLPVIYLDRPLSDDCFCVLNDNRASGAAMTARLLKHTPDIWYLDSFYGNDNPTAVERRAGYTDEMRRHGLEPRYLPVRSTIRQDNEHFAFENVSAFFSSGNSCGGLFCVTDAAALGAMAAVRKYGLTPGKDFFTGGHDDLRFGAYANPALTTMRQPLSAMCAAAFEMMQNCLRGEPPVIRRRMFNSELVVRDSG